MFYAMIKAEKIAAQVESLGLMDEILYYINYFRRCGFLKQLHTHLIEENLSGLMV